MNKEEKWIAIEGYEGIYEISNTGKVKSLQRENVGCDGVIRVLKERLLKEGNRSSGYLSVVLSKGNIQETKSIHRLVAKYFIGYPKEWEQVNHKNGDKGDNRVDNLEWVTASENITHAYEKLGKKSLLGEKHQNSKLTKSTVIYLRKNKLNIDVNKKAEELDVSTTTVRDAMNGRTWKWLKEG